ncbi:hypothetical protein CP970_25000 [Streptomyces kanamyceticus]|uniref:Lipoprotein n=2 Tax=Streptomyces kanamyceticus TaxID=1967 RepID=A0A5J6GNL2_STRKN|nr:hypothetical protein CP970_25000 [Streptomyces kanamyceticus]
MRSAAVALGACVAIGLTGGCEWTDTTAQGTATEQETLPPDTDKARSKEQADDFRAWVDAHGTKEQKKAASRVRRVIGEWDDKTGNAYVSTDINGGTTPVKDPMATARALAAAFDDWKDSKEGYVSVYDVFGNALVTNETF